MLHLDKYFAPKVCVGIVRYKFFQRKQEKGELVDDYIADLKKLALDCKFGAIHDELIRDQVVMHCNNQSIQERLWINGDSPLDEILAIVRKAEISERCFSELKSVEKNEDGIYKVTNRKIGKGLQSGENERRCYRCDSKGHLAYSKSCPALKLRCSKCGVVGHFAKVCKNKKKTVKCIYEGENVVKCDMEEKTIEPRGTDEDKNLILNITEVNTKGKLICDLKIGGVPITMYADSGSPFTIVNEDVWNKSFVGKIGKELAPPDIQPESYTGEKIDLLGFR
ncbi:hypothetical protein NDU88_006250 [Pleurodeles waltl]|uniref:CCHC-type domain-containing protein n=1 Tax=Pleurodeles waltl TaxID=8319 RepID=A0AAV7WX36_PLEWA|nr:hypothetical protein NDU88_006250 [Pleurodeles waltl]